MRGPSRRALILAAVALAALVAVAAWALLDDDGGDASGPGAVREITTEREPPGDEPPARPPGLGEDEDEEEPATQPAGPPRTADERAAVAAVLRHFRAIRAGDGDAACAELSAEGRRRLVEELRAVGASGDCEEAVLELQVPELRVEGVQVSGVRGVVVLARGLEYEVERVGGDWKLAG